MAKREQIFEFYDPPPAHLADCSKEQALCYDFIDEAQLLGWKVYPEYPDSTFDLFLVAEEGCTTVGVKPGTQIGVQAKMSANLDLLRQMLAASRRKKYGPDYIVALVPGAPRTDGERTVAEAITQLGMGFFYVYNWFEGHHTNHWKKRENLYSKQHLGSHKKFPEKVPQKFLESIPLPEVDTWTEPGVASPTPVTAFQMRAIKFVLELEQRGAVDYTVFAEHRMHVQTWLTLGWVVQDRKEGRRFLYKLNPATDKSRPDLKHPEVKMQLEKKLNTPRTIHKRKKDTNAPEHEGVEDRSKGAT